MTITLFPTSQSVRIAMTQVEYDLLAAGVVRDASTLERLLMSHCQQIQRATDETNRTTVKQFMETADAEQVTAVVTSMRDVRPRVRG